MNQLFFVGTGHPNELSEIDAQIQHLMDLRDENTKEWKDDGQFMLDTN